MLHFYAKICDKTTISATRFQNETVMIDFFPFFHFTLEVLQDEHMPRGLPLLALSPFSSRELLWRDNFQRSELLMPMWPVR